MKKLLILLIAGCFGMYGCPDENGDPDPISGCFLKKMTEPWATFQFYYDDEGRLIKVTDTESNGQQVGTWNIGYSGSKVNKITGSQSVEIRFTYEEDRLVYIAWDEDGTPPAEYTARLSYNGSKVSRILQSQGDTTFLEWRGSNISKMTRHGQDGSLTVTEFDYDNKNIPFSNNAFSLSVFYDLKQLSENNVVKETVTYPETTGSLTGYVVDYIYEYNDMDYPVRISWVNNNGGQSVSPTLFEYTCN